MENMSRKERSLNILFSLLNYKHIRNDSYIEIKEEEGIGWLLYEELKEMELIPHFDSHGPIFFGNNGLLINYIDKRLRKQEPLKCLYLKYSGRMKKGKKCSGVRLKRDCNTWQTLLKLFYNNGLINEFMNSDYCKDIEPKQFCKCKKQFKYCLNLIEEVIKNEM